MHLTSIIRNLTSRPLSETVTIARDRATDVANRLLAMPMVPFALAQVRNAARPRPRNRRLVVFVSQKPRAREAKLAYGLRSAGWQVVLLYEKAPSFNAAEYFDEARRYRNEWQALVIASTYAASVYHVFSAFADALATVFIKHKPGKVVFDVYDVWQTFRFTHSLKRRIERQRFCLEHADALCCRDLKLKHVARRNRYVLPRSVILFPEYCWDRPEITNYTTQKRKRDEIHVVLAGSFGVEKRGFGDAGYLGIAEALTAQRIHLHIYPHSLAISDKRCEADYVALASRTPFLHLHRSRPMDDLIPELSQYDIGIAVTKFLTYGEEPRLYEPEMFRYCGSSRVTDYLDAALPIITNKEMSFIYFTASRYGVAVNGSLPVIQNARQHLTPVCGNGVRERIRQRRSAYSVARHVHRLSQFYESL